MAYVNERGGKLRTRPWCDATEVAAMFGRVAPGYTAAEWVTRLREFRDPATGLAAEHGNQSCCEARLKCQSAQ